MGHSFAVGFLVFALCIIACVFESTTAAGEQVQTLEITETVAQQAVDAAQNSIRQVSENAQNNLTSTRDVLEKVESSKAKADKAEGEAEQTAKDNAKAKGIVVNIKTISHGVTGLHESVKAKLVKTISSLEKVVSEADKLEKQCKTVLPLADAASNTYAGAQAKALEIKGNADNLNTNITKALAEIEGVSSTADNMEQSANDVELKNLQVSGIVAVTEIESIIGDTGSDIDETQNKKREVNGIVQAMRDLKKQISSKPPEHINELFQSINDELRKATDVLKEAEQHKTDMTTQKQKADAALSSIETAKYVITAQGEVDTAKECLKQVKAIVPVLKSALETAKTSVKNAKNRSKNLWKLCPPPPLHQVLRKLKKQKSPIIQ